MIRQITIQGLKHINKLIFDVPPPGVHLLSGANGSGKSSLLACLLRLGWKNAFPRFFRTSKISKKLDQFEGSSITYKFGDEEVTYAYSGERWAPNPRKNSDLVKKFGFGTVIYVGADAQRVEPRPEDFIPQRVRDASVEIRNAANDIFGDQRFNELKIINVRKGVGAEAFLFIDSKKSIKNNIYVSEKNFSLGELCVLKLLRQLSLCTSGSLVLIDELELALHPRAQIGLLRYLEKIAADKNLTVIFSTHSVNLIKSVKRNQILFLYNDNDEITCIKAPYPAFVLGQLAYQEECTPDVVLYVEDDLAQYIVDGFIKNLLRDRFFGKPKPTIVIVPIGGYLAVIAFLARAKSLLPATTKQFALLDKDVEDEYLEKIKAEENYSCLAEIKSLEAQIKYLLWTPEVGMVKLFALSPSSQENSLRNFLGDQRISLTTRDFNSVISTQGKVQRVAAKKFVRGLTEEISRLKACDVNKALRDLSDYFVEQCLNGANSAQITSLLMPLMS